MKTDDAMRGWFMTPEQAERIRTTAERLGTTPWDLVRTLLGKLGDRFDTYYLEKKLLWQLYWLLEDLPVDKAPYLRIYRRYGVNPQGGLLHPGQVDMTVSQFVELMEKTCPTA